MNLRARNQANRTYWMKTNAWNERGERFWSIHTYVTKKHLTMKTKTENKNTRKPTHRHTHTVIGRQRKSHINTFRATHDHFISANNLSSLCLWLMICLKVSRSCVFVLFFFLRLYFANHFANCKSMIFPKIARVKTNTHTTTVAGIFSVEAQEKKNYEILM